ncbi:hypothetical protein BU23DRAFT_574435 [Bimuria novae-zelandiae CBS 107.79]|uniref:Uncharacterized protein n=1 Tax=Bimuria novae-zelandiae CBS 107.79 TaxID=1447943 RepID=A0A6A5UXX4_9PLEO|nr:hypothetical protein BU23DRAFT_574435 [Bimuria novae-zelandiae CBS 107.79]
MVRAIRIRDEAGVDDIPAPVPQDEPESQQESSSPSPLIMNDDLPDLAPRNPDQYPFSFWPPLPWPDDHARDDLAELPHKWQAANAPPTASGARNDWEAERDAVRQEWNNAGILSEEFASRWVGAGFIGQGVHGSAGLWVNVDDDNVVTDRMVAKDTTASDLS